MSNYAIIAAEFARVGYPDSARLREYELNAALDKIAQSSALAQPQFERSVSEELFEQTTKDADGAVLLKQYIGVILKAHDALENHIQVHRQEYKNQSNDEKRSEIQTALYQFYEDLRILTVPFHLPEPEKIPELEGYSDQIVSEAGSAIFEPSFTSEQVSPSLKWALILTILSLFFQFLQSSLKNDFTNIFALLMVLTIYLLNYFDRFYIRVCIIAIATSLLMDLAWMIALWATLWNPQPDIHHGTLRPSYLRYVFVMTIILMAARIAIGAVLYRFKDNEQKIRRVVRIYLLQFELTGNPDNNIVTNLFADKPKHVYNY